MLSKIQVTHRDAGGKIDIELPNGVSYRITVWDASPEIVINTPDGRLIVMPNVVNEIKITTQTD